MQGVSVFLRPLLHTAYYLHSVFIPFEQLLNRGQNGTLLPSERLYLVLGQFQKIVNFVSLFITKESIPGQESIPAQESIILPRNC